MELGYAGAMLRTPIGQGPPLGDGFVGTRLTEPGIFPELFIGRLHGARTARCPRHYPLCTHRILPAARHYLLL